MFWVVLVPLALAFMLVGLARLEDWVVGPMDRAARIRRLLESDVSGDEIERAVAALLAPVVADVSSADALLGARGGFDEPEAARYRAV